jgi:mono/diheme cytochrome c family protein
MAHGKHGGAGIYVVVALILGVITFIEYYIVEFPPVWLSSGWVLFWLVTLSLAKFWMVIWFFMHLKDDDKLYTGFFASGMVIALGTFVVMALMFLLPRAVAPVIAEAQAEAHVDAHAEALPDEVRELIDSDGLSRGIADRADAPRPKDQSLEVVPPAAPETGFALRDPAAAALEPQAAEEAAPDAAVAEVPFDRELGAQVYAQNCAGCHQATGQGIPGAFPPLADHAPDIYNAAGGREVLIAILVGGMQGPITVEGQTYDGFMPAWRQLDDEQIASVINHVVTAWGNEDDLVDFVAIAPEEVAAERDSGRTAADVHALRVALEPDAAPEPEAEPEPAEDIAAEAPDPEFDRALGEQVYAQNCSACHQATGQGIPGAFPPLAGHAPELYAVDGGRTLLIDILLYGLQGPITVSGQGYNGLMPAWAQLSDEQAAAVVNHILTAWGNEDAIDDFDAIRAAEVAAERDKGLSPGAVHELRTSLGLD